MFNFDGLDRMQGVSAARYAVCTARQLARIGQTQKWAMCAEHSCERQWTMAVPVMHSDTQHFRTLSHGPLEIQTDMAACRSTRCFRLKCILLGHVAQRFRRKAIGIADMHCAIYSNVALQVACCCCCCGRSSFSFSRLACCRASSSASFTCTQQ